MFIWEIKWKLFSHIHIVGTPKVFPIFLCGSQMWKETFLNECRCGERKFSNRRFTEGRKQNTLKCASLLHSTWEIFYIYLHNELCLLLQKLFSRQSCYCYLLDSVQQYHSLKSILTTILAHQMVLVERLICLHRTCRHATQ